MMFQVPYYAVIFTSTIKNDEGYAQMAQAMEQLVKKQKGFLGFDSAREAIGITVSYWSDLESIREWRNHPEHGIAMQLGKEKWYDQYSLRVCKVEREYEF